VSILWEYGFVQRALLAGLAIGIGSAFLGVFLLLRREAMIGHGLGHIIFSGIALALFLNFAPLPIALAVAVLAALAILKLKTRAGLHSDTAIAIFSSVGMSMGILLVTLVNRFGVDLLSYLFGDILAVNKTETALSLVLAFIVIIFIAYFYHQLLFLTFAPDSARAFGLKTERLEATLTVLTAVTLVLGMKIVGLLLMTSILVIPAATGLQLAKSFFASCLLAAGAAAFSVIIGLWLSLTADLPAAATIVLISFVLFLASFLRRRRRLF